MIVQTMLMGLGNKRKMTKRKKHTFVKNEDAKVTECEICGYIWGQEEKKGCTKLKDIVEVK